jgi:hypothetical protein
MTVTKNVTTNRNDSPRLAFSINEVARKLGVSPGLLRLESQRGRLKVSRIGRRVVVRTDELARYLNVAAQ